MNSDASRLQRYLAKAKASHLLPKEFVEVYRYDVIDGAVANAKVLNERLWRSEGVVYVRVCESKVLYVGKSDSSLRGRILRHVRGFETSGKEIFEDYKKCVNGKTVSVLAYKPKSRRLLDLDVPAHIGLEWAMIKEFEPPFVRRR